MEILRTTCDLATAFLEHIHERPVGPPVSYADLLARMRVPLTDDGEDPVAVIRDLAQSADPGLVASPGPRYFGFVVGGAHPVSVAADWLAAAWDQNAFSYVQSPAAAVVEEIARTWLLELLGLPSDMSAGFVTGGSMANFTALAAARHAVLKRRGWDVESRGLLGAPAVTVLTSEESHISVYSALQLLGLGRDRVHKIPTDEQGRMRPDELRRALSSLSAPPIVCAQVGNVNTGAFDPLPEIAAAVHDRDGWLHVDGAFGLWAAASPRLRHLSRGIDSADSIGLDCHKWLNVPQDSGVTLVRDTTAHRTAMTTMAAYYVPGPNEARENHNWVPEASRRARGFAVYAALRSLGRNGVATVVDRCCQLARRMPTPSPPTRACRSSTTSF